MRVFLIIVAVFVVIFALILSVSAELTVIFDNGWTTRVRVLFIEKDIELSKILSFLLFPEKAAETVAEEQKAEKKKKQQKEEVKAAESKKEDKPANPNPAETEPEEIKADPEKNNTQVTEQKPQKTNPIKKIIDQDGILGIMLLVSNLMQTAGSAVSTLIKGLHIYSLYVKIIVGGGDAADIANMYGTICGAYYPIKGMIMSGMKVDQYDEYIMPDFIAPSTEYGFQFIGSINIRLLLKVALRAVKVFLVNFIKNK